MNINYLDLFLNSIVMLVNEFLKILRLIYIV